MDFFNSIERSNVFFDNNIYNIVEESCGPYFAGDRTMDDTITLIQNRVQLYVSEQR